MKKNKWRPAVRSALCVAILAATAGCAEKKPVKPAEAPAAQAVLQQTAVDPAQAKSILLRMAQFVAKSPRFTVNLQGSYEVVQESGEKIEFGENRKITVNRPNGLRVDVEHSDGEKHVVLYDGKTITTYTPSQNVYAQVDKPGGIDEAVTYFLRDLHMRLPLAALLLSRFPEEIDQRTQSIAYVEKTLVQGVVAHHLAGRTETVDYQAWIADGAQPLPLRVVLTYKNADGQPTFRAQFNDWNISPQADESLFAFKPPAGTRKIAFAAEIPTIAPRAAEASEKTGGKP